MRRMILFAALIVSAALLAWSAAAPWAAAFRSNDERFKVSLFGVRHVTGLAKPPAAQQRCGWGSDDPACAPRDPRAFAFLGSARWFVALAALLLFARRRAALVVAALSVSIAVVLVRVSVARALAVLAALQTTTNGSGIVAAQLAVATLLIAAMSSAGRAGSPAADRASPRASR